MYHSMNGGNWVFMTFAMVFGIGVPGAVIYAAVRVANRPPAERQFKS